MATSLDKFAERKPGWDTPLIVESHLNGERTKEMNPNTPRTYQEVIDDAIACWDAGACCIHTHNTNFDLNGEAAAKDYHPVYDEVLRQRPDVVWYPTTCNRELLTEDQFGTEHAGILHRTHNVNISCIDTGINLFAFDVNEKGHIEGREYGWNYRQVAGQVDQALANKMSIIWGVYEPGQLRLAAHYVNRGMSTPGSFYDFYLIGPYALTSTKAIGTSGMEPTLESLYYYLDMMEAISDPKARTNWCISIWGEGDRDTRDVIRRTIELGGHVKTGLELFYDPARNPTNLELLKEVQDIAREVGRPLATHEEAREIYGIAEQHEAGKARMALEPA